MPETQTPRGQAPAQAKRPVRQSSLAKLTPAQQRRRTTVKESMQRREQYTQLWMLWHQKLLKPINAPTLQQAARYLTPQDYDDVVAERASLKLCGYPLCAKAAQGLEQRYHISLARRKVYDMSERANYCSGACMVASRYYRYQLPKDPVYMRGRDELRIDVLPLGHKPDAELDSVAGDAGAPDNSKWYRQKLVERMQIPDDVAANNPLQIVEHNSQTAEFDIAKGMSSLSFADVEGFASAIDAARIKRAVEQTNASRQPAAKEPVGKAPSPSAKTGMEAERTTGGSNANMLQVGNTLGMADALGMSESEAESDDTESEDAKDQGLFKKQFGEAGLSQFGRLWMLLDCVATEHTRKLLTDLQRGDMDSAASYYAAPGDKSMATRQGLVADGILRALASANWLGPTSVDYEMRVLISTLELHSNMVVFTSAELRLLGAVFVLALARAKDTLQQAIGPELDAELADLGSDRGLTNMAANRLYEQY
ncbi:hypothetical protein IWW54_004084 [Coemansia sp. RSA 2705]|nr:hypothetical protein IWW54_004084 [Coemansia sp. RSA 2705]